MNEMIQVEDGYEAVIDQLIGLERQLLKAQSTKIRTYGQVDISSSAVKINGLKAKIKNLKNFVKMVGGSK
jgi:hypothetical protein